MKKINSKIWNLWKFSQALIYTYVYVVFFSFWKIFCCFTSEYQRLSLKSMLGSFWSCNNMNAIKLITEALSGNVEMKNSNESAFAYDSISYFIVLR